MHSNVHGLLHHLKREISQIELCPKVYNPDKDIDKAIKAGVQEAYLVSANNFIYLGQKKNAIQTLKNYKVKYPEEGEIADRLIAEIEKQGRYNVWQILNNPAKS